LNRIVAIAVALAAGSALAARAQEKRLADLTPIPLQSGINNIPRLTPDGRDGLIILAWRDNGNAHGYDVALVLTQGGRGGPWNVVRRNGLAGQTDQGSDEITDEPHTGEDMVKAFRFARGRVDGDSATLLLTATRDTAESIPSPSRVIFDVYRLDSAPDVGTTPDHFTPILHDRSASSYCNADLALSQRFGIPLRTSYRGSRARDGC
jgi:hypothetical protein